MSKNLFKNGLVTHTNGHKSENILIAKGKIIAIDDVHNEKAHLPKTYADNLSINHKPLLAAPPTNKKGAGFGSGGVPC